MWNCACCTKLLPDSALQWIVVDGETGDEVAVGSDCGKKTREAGEDGHYHDNAGTGPFYTKAVYEGMENEVHANRA